jgi:hypothetical protein
MPDRTKGNCEPEFGAYGCAAAQINVDRRMKTRYIVALLIVVACAIVAFLPRTLATSHFSLRPQSFTSSVYTCDLCGSTRSVDTKYILGYIPKQTAVRVSYKSPGFASCSHQWESGISCSPPDPVPDGAVVLVREKRKYGAFILRNQTSSPEHAEYDWWYQSDGTGTLDTNSTTISSGHGTTPKITFGSFTLSWSAHTTGSGWLYYKHSAGALVTSNDFHMCITDLSSVAGVDAADVKWEYKATPVD